MKKKIIRALPDIALMVLLGFSFRTSIWLGFLTVIVWAAIGFTNKPTKIYVNEKERKIIN
ncbi:hypothetical protein I6N96_03330 [Enterococcus sp. BWM-S5]|uniref:Uncharacterized protein n=1 Tax=Enterococcus larvae TaxID=2794352 RepID=A0ABS4CH00_9ENTE|nr:hypothetical protein [Enterococcus larvae]MBP1045295.1 hypothetical protein [Enterococcus larvae]